MKPRIFFFHYNKPASRAAGRAKVSVHQGGVCHVVDNIECHVHTWGRLRTAKQPHFVMAGKGVLRVDTGTDGRSTAHVFASESAAESVHSMFPRESSRIGAAFAIRVLETHPASYAQDPSQQAIFPGQLGGVLRVRPAERT